MWEFDEAVEVRANDVSGAPVPDQFLWRGRLWKVCAIRARWVETAVWWERGVIGAGIGTPTTTRLHSAADTHAHPARPDAWFTTHPTSETHPSELTTDAHVHPATRPTATPTSPGSGPHPSELTSDARFQPDARSTAALTSAGSGPHSSGLTADAGIHPSSVGSEDRPNGSARDGRIHPVRPEAWLRAAATSRPVAAGQPAGAVVRPAAGREAGAPPVGAEAPSAGQGPACSGEVRGSRFRPAVAGCTLEFEGGHRAAGPAVKSATTAAATTGVAATGAVAAGAGALESPAAVGVLDADWGPNRTVYRVEAGFGRDSRRELFDLAHDPDSGRWQLERVMDR